MKRCKAFISIIGIYIIMFGSHITFCWFYTRFKALHLIKYAWQRIISQDYNVNIKKCNYYFFCDFYNDPDSQEFSRNL